MEELAGAACGVAVILEPERQGGDVGPQLTEVGAVDVEAEGAGAQSREHARARGVADGLLAVCAGEGGAARGEGVEMRGEGGRSVAAELGPQVVGGNEEDVWRRGAGHRRPSGKSQDCQDEAGERRFHLPRGCLRGLRRESSFCQDGRDLGDFT